MLRLRPAARQEGSVLPALRGEAAAEASRAMHGSLNESTWKEILMPQNVEERLAKLGLSLPDAPSNRIINAILKIAD